MIDDGFRLLPEQASTHAPRVDLLYFFLLGMASFFTVLIAALILYFSIKYRRGNTTVDRTPGPDRAFILEIVWMVIPFAISMLIFYWGATLYFTAYRPPAGATEVRVVAKQWMWKFQHPNGRREINTLHVPLGQPMKLLMISEDVIHSLYVPAFRIKRDVLPGSYSTCWFEATRIGEFHLFCAEYCGTNHSRMTGSVIVMAPDEYESWLAGSQVNESPVKAGQRLFEELRCASCHQPDGATARCPPVAGLYGRDVTLTGGTKVTADENYLRESILRPGAKVVTGYEPLMPSFDGQVDEEQLLQLIAYIKSLAKP
jgi:cytochrome c oxidase subunit 2